MKLEDWLVSWLEDYIKIGIKDRTYRMYQYIVERYIVGRIGLCEVESVTCQMLQKYISTLSEKNLSENTLKLIWRIVSSGLKMAQVEYNLPQLALERVKIPKSEEKKVDAFSAGEQKSIEKVINISSHPKQIGVMLSLYLGLRLGEVCALKWSDIDFKSRMLSVVRSVYLKLDKVSGSSLSFSTPKTSSSVRKIPVPVFLMDMLRQVKKTSTSEFVVSQNGHCMVPRTYQYEFESLQKKAGVQKKGFHSLRHTFATRALECGMDIKSLAEIMGHKNPNVTLARYAHSMLEHKKNMMDKLGRIHKN